MVKISKEEYWVLKGIDVSWKWIARDSNYSLWVYEKDPRKREDFWDAFSGDCDILDSDLFQFIQWENEYPYSIAELVEGYENWVKDYEVDWDKVFGREGKETGVKKDKKWLKEAVLELHNNGNPEINETEEERELGRAQQWAWNNCVDRVYELINQLDEPEVEKLERKIKYLDSYNDELIRDNNQLRNELDNQEVLSQDLQAIPSYVAEWVEKYIEYGFDLYPALKRLENNAPRWKNIYDWYRKNTHKFVNAYLTGKYEVETERKYLVNILDEGNGAYLIYYPKTGNYGVTGILDDSKGITRFTEQEIKSLPKGNVYFEHFAKRVEELE